MEVILGSSKSMIHQSIKKMILGSSLDKKSLLLYNILDSDPLTTIKKAGKEVLYNFLNDKNQFFLSNNEREQIK